MVKIIFLGTGAQIPTVKRNHSATLLNYNEENILVDCGEGIQRQFRIGKLNPGKITRILITHIHGDHVFGLPGFLSTLNFSEYNKKLYIYGPKGVKKFLGSFLDISGVGRNFEIVIEEVFPKGMASKEASGIFFENKDFYLEAEEMDHGVPTNAYSFVLKDKLRIDKKKLFKSGLKEGKHLSSLIEGKDIVYEGKKFKAKDLTYLEKGKKVSFVLDTKNNERICPFVKDADLFVCESSFGSDLKNEAKEKMHLTSEDAGKLAKKARVKKLILTHVSQRYEPNLKFLLEDARKNFKNVEIANDFDVVLV